MNPVRTDVAAETHALYRLGRLAVREINSNDYAITFERYVNAHGVPVRRVVLYGPEECDPTTPASPAVGTDFYSGSDPLEDFFASGLSSTTLNKLAAHAAECTTLGQGSPELALVAAAINRARGIPTAPAKP